MNYVDFSELLNRFSEHPFPATINRHVYLWIGEIDNLLINTPKSFLHKLDLHLLCKDILRTPLGEKAAGRELSGAIDNWLVKHFPPVLKQRALLIIGLDLFYRYKLPFTCFTRLANENTMIIFGLSKMDLAFLPSKPLPSYIQISPKDIESYITSQISNEAVVTED